MDRLAVLIDADNAKPKLIEPLLKEIAKYGRATVKRIYGDWTNSRLASWKDLLHKYALQPIQQFTYTVGKNSTDSALIIDAMDLLYTRNFDGFCLISSDSDFTKLALRIREWGLLVYGFGERKTPESFVAACDKFIHTEILESDRKTSLKDSSNKEERTSNQDPKGEQELIKLLMDAYVATNKKEGWVKLTAFASKLAKLYPSFSVKKYGYKKLTALIEGVKCFEFREIPHQKKSNLKIIEMKFLE